MQATTYQILITQDYKAKPVNACPGEVFNSSKAAIAKAWELFYSRHPLSVSVIQTMEIKRLEKVTDPNDLLT